MRDIFPLIIAIECYLFYLLFKDVFNLTPPNKLKLCVYYGSLIFLTNLSVVRSNWMYIYGVLLIGHGLIIYILCKESIAKKFAIIITAIIIAFCVEMVTLIGSSYILTVFGLEPAQNLFYLFYYTLFLFNGFISVKFYKFISRSLYSPRYSLYCLPVMSFIIIILLTINDSQVNHLAFITIILILLLSNILYFITQAQMLQLAAEKSQDELANQEAQSYLKLYEMLQHDHKEIITLKHNFKYDLISIQTAIQQNDLQKALNTIQDKLKITQKPTAFICNIPIITALINYKLFELEQYNKHNNNKIILDIQVIVDDVPNVDDGHLSNILGNLLDNAITACKKDTCDEEKIILISICQHQNNLNITVRNKTQEQPCFTHGLPLSSKRVAQHGIGLTTIRSIVKKYNGHLNVNMKNKEFVVSIVLFNCCQV